MYYAEDKFTQEEKDAMDGLARVVSFVCGVSYDELRSKTRKQPIVDARKIACKYAVDNIPNSLIFGSRNNALPSWFFNVDHSSVIHAVNSAEWLYEYDKRFARLYNAVIELVDNPESEIDLHFDDKFTKEKIWDSVRMNEREPHRTRYALLPENVKNVIIDSYEKGYSELTIANKAETLLAFIQYFVKREGLNRNKMDKIRKALASASVKFGQSTSIEY